MLSSGKFMIRIIAMLCLAVSVFFIVGCGGVQTQVDLSAYVWPRPPEVPRVKLVRFIYTDLDVREKSSLETIFGEDASFSFGKPHGIAVDDNENIYVTDTLRRQVSIVNLKYGSIGTLSHPYGWSTPMGVAVDNKNKLVAVTDAAKGMVYIFDMVSGTLKDQAKKDILKAPVGVALDSERNLMYVTDTKKQGIFIFKNNGEYVGQLAESGPDQGQVYFPSGIALDKDGNIYVVDTMNFRIQIISPEGKFIKQFGQHGDSPGSVARPKGIAISDDGYVFVTDAAFGNFQIFDKNGIVYLNVGATGLGFGMFRIPQGIFVDHQDKVYVVDSINYRVQIFQYLSERYKLQHPEDPVFHRNDTYVAPVVNPKKRLPQ